MPQPDLTNAAPVRFRRRPAPATLLATLALVVAVSGAGVATAAALIDGSTIKRNTVTGKQVKESTLAKVPRAAAADRLTVLPSGQSMSGMFGDGAGNSTGAGGFLSAGITYPRPLAKPIAQDNIIDVGTAASAPHCPGIGRAAPGYLCLYSSISFGVEPGYGYSDDSYIWEKGRSFGVVLQWPVIDNDPYVGGSWTVTAP